MRKRKREPLNPTKAAYQKGYRAGREYRTSNLRFATDHLPEPFAVLRNERWYSFRRYTTDVLPVDGVLYRDGTAWDTKNGWRPYLFSPIYLRRMEKAWVTRARMELETETAESTV